MESANDTKRKQWPMLLLLAVGSFFYFRFIRFKAPQEINVGNLQLRDSAGHNLPENLYHGKAVVLNFWAPWCGPCRMETPWLQALQDKHQDDLVVIGVDDDSDTNYQIDSFANLYGVHYPLVTKNAHVRDVVGNVEGVPVTLYINRVGHVVHTVSGAVSQSVMESFASDALKP